MNRKQLLYIVPHEFFPARNGGQLRIYNILKGLCEEYDTTVVFYSNNESNQSLLEDHLNHIRFLKLNPVGLKNISAVQKLIIKLKIRRLFKIDSFTYLLSYLLNKELRQSSYDIILFEHLESLHASYRVIDSLSKSSRKIINLHNIDHELWKSEYDTHPDKKQLLSYAARALRIEKSLHRKVDLALVCSSEDQNKIIDLNKGRLESIIVPNGTVIPEDIPKNRKVPSSILFVGALDFFPNIEGLRWFYNEVWPLIVSEIPEANLKVVGRGNESNISFLKHPGITIIGEVSSVSSYYFESKVSIVPLLHGSGTRLKIPEAMAHQVPVVSTSKGAEGNNYEDRQNLLIADSAELFASYVVSVCRDEFREIGTNAFDWVINSLTWESISKELSVEIEKRF